MRTGELGIEFEAGQYLFRHGEDGDRMFLVLEGEVEILLQQDERHVRIASCGVGEYLGEEVILEGARRSADARAVTKVRVLAVDRRNFLRRASKDPTLLFHIVQQLNRRVRELSAEVVRLRLADPR